MSRVRILPEILSNKIAAGEVVERPASVVKELVENALDAGATRILIDVEQGGQAMVRVADNGSGMLRDDALLAIERYATSKIATDEDLFRIRTLGFRGEALPSIAAVSRFSLVTREAAADSGTEVVIEGGKLVSAAETGAAPGTMVTVRAALLQHARPAQVSQGHRDRDGPHLRHRRRHGARLAAGPVPAHPQRAHRERLARRLRPVRPRRGGARRRLPGRAAPHRPDAWRRSRSAAGSRAPGSTASRRAAFSSSSTTGTSGTASCSTPCSRAISSGS